MVNLKCTHFHIWCGNTFLPVILLFYKTRFRFAVLLRVTENRKVLFASCHLSSSDELSPSCNAGILNNDVLFCRAPREGSISFIYCRFLLPGQNALWHMYDLLLNYRTISYLKFWHLHFFTKSEILTRRVLHRVCP